MLTSDLEWLLDDNNEPMQFADVEEAEQFLLDNGEIAENLDSYVFETEEEA